MRLATILAAAFWAAPCALATVAYISLLRQARRRDARTKAENERRRAIHPSGRDVSKRTVHVAADSEKVWAEFDYWNSEDAR